jgi:hypothetical protein
VHKLIGHLVTIEFNLPSTEWPIAGFPAWGIITAVDMPLIEVQGYHVRSSLTWVNVKDVKKITDCGVDPIRKEG